GEDDWFPATPDQFFNEEWWGIMAVEKNLTTGKPDVMIPRKVYGVLQEKFLEGLANQAPVLDTIGSQTALVGRAFSLTIAASDVNGDDLIMTVVQDSGAAISQLGASFTQTSSGQATFSWTPTSSQLGKTFTFVVTVADAEGLTDQETFSVTVTLPLPVVTAIEPAEGKAGDQVTIHGNYFGTLLADAQYSPSADFNHDGIVDVADFKIFYVSYRLKTGDAGFNALADFNGDGVVDLKDLNIFVSHYRSSANGTYVAFSPMEGPSAQIISWSDTTIVCVVPANARSGPLKVHTPYGLSNAVEFTMNGFPMITQIAPSPAFRDATVEITGSWFGAYTVVGYYDPAVDIDHDGDVDYADFQQWYVSYKTFAGQERYQAVHDFNHDGAINSVDLNLFVKAYRSTRGKSFVLFGGGVEAKVVSWTATRIVCQVPYFAVSGDVKVVADGVASAGWPLTIQ
ncbi:MAG TPA: putative Ig domain-containing protein, partial [Candidatus Bathyarchaeia archaeon]|nr:putative Ig domain-containing protein [Candidatus Bathyarchaeia archaeon]